MNTADINAARRLIDQFEDKALGRHNSNQWNRPGQQAPEQRWQHVHPKDSPQQCEVGDYCWSLGINIPDNQMIAMVLKVSSPNLSTYKGEWNPSFLEYAAMEFERVRLIVNGSRGRNAWRRVA